MSKNKFTKYGMNEDKLNISDINIKSKLNINNKYIVTYIAEISKRKNQFKFLDTLKKYNIDNDILFLIIGDSNIKNVGDKFLKYDNVLYLDFREDIGNYLNISDLVISVSTQEGLPQNMLEAMWFNKMIIATNIRGNRDLINGKNGILVDSLDDLVKEIIKYKNNKSKKKISNNVSKYRINKVLKDNVKIYNYYLDKK